MAESTTSTPRKEMTLEEARDEIKKCEEEIQSIKSALRAISSTNSSDANSLEIEFTKVRSFFMHLIYILKKSLDEFVFISFLRTRSKFVRLVFTP